MPKFSEQTFNTWRKPPSDNEENKLVNARTQVVNALNRNKFLNALPIEVFGQGSYANDTNVRLNSDIDLNVMYKGEEYFELPQGKTNDDYGIVLSNKIQYSDYKNQVETALVTEFGRNNVVRNNKCIHVLASQNRVQCDVVPTFQYRRYNEGSLTNVGIKFFADNGEQVINFPKQHIQNAIEKNSRTSKSFKRITRIFRKLRYRLRDENIDFPSGITSYLLECLTWNVPNDIYNQHNTWTDIVRSSIVHLYKNTETTDACKNWGEVSELFYLFYQGRKWTVKDVNDFMQILWNYIEF